MVVDDSGRGGRGDRLAGSAPTRRLGKNFNSLHLLLPCFHYRGPSYCLLHLVVRFCPRRRCPRLPPSDAPSTVIPHQMAVAVQLGHLQNNLVTMMLQLIWSSELPPFPYPFPPLPALTIQLFRIDVAFLFVVPVEKLHRLNPRTLFQ